MTVEVTVSHLGETEVVLTGPDALAEWREKHRVQVPGYEHTYRYKKGWWDGTWAPGAWCRQREGCWEMRCSRGLLPRILKALGYEYSVLYTDAVTAQAFLEKHPRHKDLRDYQRTAYLEVLTNGWGRIALATNAGKGAVIALLADAMAQQGKTVLVCCDEVAVFDALLGELRFWTGDEPAVIKAGAKQTPSSTDRIVLTMVRTLSNRLEKEEKVKDSKARPWTTWMEGLAMVLLDEADKATAPTWLRVIDAAKNTRWRAGFSGSFPTDLYGDLVMDTIMGPVLVEAKNLELVDRGISAKPLITLYSFDVGPALRRAPREKYEELRPWTYDNAITRNQTRHAFIASLVRPNTPTAIIVNRIEHGEALTEAIPGAVFLDGSVEADERIRVLDQFKAGELNVLVITKILDRGTNRLGHAADIIFAAGEGSTRQTLQRIGRGLRRSEGKEYLRLVDVVDRVSNPDDHRLDRAADGFLHPAGRRRVQLYRDEGFDVEIKKA